MATTTRYPIRIPLRLPRPIEPTESPASKPNRPQTPNLPPTLHTSAPCFRSKQRQPTRSNLHSLNSWPAVQCNEGFCNAPQKSVLYPDHDHGVAETSPFREWRVPSLVPVAPGYRKLPLSAEIQSGRRDKPDGQTRTSHGCVRTTWLPPVSSHLASAGAGPERYAAVVKPPGRGEA